jgi:hypothetical protein
MPRRTHPSKNVAPEQLKPSQMTVTENTSASRVQVNETFRLDGKDGGVPLGKNGETRAFGKPQVTYRKGIDVLAMSTPEEKAAGNWATASSFLFKNQQAMEGDANLGGDRGLLTRAVAAHRVDALLGLNSIAEEKYGQTKNGKLMGVSVQVPGEPVVTIKDGNNSTLDIDYRNPKIQRGLSDLEVSDYIMGQIDRHLGNVYIDAATGEVKGIDNDLCLSEQDRSEIMKDGLVNTKAIAGPPIMMHRETAQKILDADPNELRATMRNAAIKGSQPLSEDAIEGAITRLEELKKGIRDGGIDVVDQFDDTTYDRALDTEEKTFQTIRPGETFDQTEAEFAKTQVLKGTGDMKRMPKSSLLGKVLVEQRLAKVEQGNVLRQGNGGTINRRSPSEVEDARAYQSMSGPQKKEFDKEFAKLARKEKLLEEKEKHLQKLGKPGLLDKIRSIPDGGVKGARRHDQRRIDQLKQEVTELNKSLDQKLDGHKVKQQQQLDTQPSQVRQVEQSSVSNAVSQNSDDVLRTARRGSDEVEGKGKEKLLDSVDGQDLGSGIQQDMGQSKPQITREESVRELMKRQGAVRLAKEKLGLAGNQDTGTVPKIPLKPKVSK